MTQRASAPSGPVQTAVPTSFDPNVLQAERAEVTHVPSAMEAAANQESLAIIRKLYGSRAQTLIDILLSFDAYFAWYYPFKKSIPLDAPMQKREERALENCRTAIDMQESFERLTSSSNGHCSFLPHGAVFKVTRDILEVGRGGTCVGV